MTQSDLILPLLGLLTGLALGALGSGGSILALPAFVFGANVPVSSAFPTSLLVVGAVSLIGALMAAMRCRTAGCPGQEADPAAIALVGGFGMAGSFVGARLAADLSDSIHMALFGATVVAAALAMVRSTIGAERSDAPTDTRRTWTMPIVGLGVGLLTGVVGVGGGFLIVPAMSLAAGLPIKRAISTSLWIISANSMVGVIGYSSHATIAAAPAAIFLVSALFGMHAGQRIAARAQPRQLRLAFACFLVLVGAFTVFRSTVDRYKSHSRSHAVSGQIAT